MIREAAGHLLICSKSTKMEKRLHSMGSVGTRTHTVPVEWVNFCRVFVKLQKGSKQKLVTSSAFLFTALEVSPTASLLSETTGGGGLLSL